MRLAFLIPVAALAACSSGASKLSVSTKVVGGTPAPAALTAGAPASNALAIGTHVTLDRARILIRKVVLEAEGPGEETEVMAGPYVIDLSGSNLDGGVAFQFDSTVPAGTYDEGSFQVHKLTPGQSVSDTDFTPGGNSIILALTVDGKPFTFTSDLTAVAEIEGPITIAKGGSANVTVTIDPSKWFTAPDGSYLDPTLAANQAQIELNIKASIRGFEDDDHDGKPDHS